MNIRMRFRSHNLLVVALILLGWGMFAFHWETQGEPSTAAPVTSRFGAQQVAVEGPINQETITETEWQGMQEKVFRELRGAGIGWGRYLSRWDVLRPLIDRPDGYDFSKADFATGAASRAGIALIGQLNNRRGPGSLQGQVPLTDREAYMEYVRVTVERYDGDSDFGVPEGHPAFPYCDFDHDGKITDAEKTQWGKTHQIHCWEIVKEPVGRERVSPSGEKVPGISAEQVVELLEAGYTAIKQADPNALVLFGGLAPGPVGGIDALESYLNDILNAGGGKYFDVIGVDAFTEPVEPMMEIHRKILKSHGLNKQIWMIQVGTNAVGPGRLSIEGGTPAKQAAYVVKSFVQSFAGGAEKVFWGDFMYRSDEPDRNIWHDYGLLHYDAVHKRPGFYTYKLLISKLEGFTSARKINNGQYVFEFSGKPPVVVLWKPSGEGTVDLSSLLKSNEAVVTHIVDEKESSTPRTERVRASAVPVGEKPVFVEAAAQKMSDPQTSEADNTRRYGEAIVREARVWDLLSQVERCDVYLQINWSGNEMLEALKSQLKEARTKLQLERSGDWNRIDYKQLESTLNSIEEMATALLERKLKELAEQNPQFKTSSSAQSPAQEQDFNFRLYYVLRINDFYQRYPDLKGQLSYYTGRGNWNAVKPFGFDVVQPHGWLCSRPPEKDTGEAGHPMAPDYDLGLMDQMIEKDFAEGYTTHFDIHLPGAAGTDTKAIWNREEWPRLTAALQRIAEHCRNKPGVAGYEPVNEAGLWIQPENLPYVESAFREYLQEKYGDIAKLNAELNTSFQSFDQIILTLPSLPQKGRRSEYGLISGPPSLRYELQKCRQKQLVEYLGALRQALKTSDPDRQVMSMLIFDGPIMSRVRQGQDPFALSKLPWDILGIHHFNRELPSDLQLHSYCVNRSSGHPHWNDQACYPWYHQVTGEPVTDERLLRAAMEFDLWNDIAWGVRGFDFYVLDESWAAWNNCLRFIDKEHAVKVGENVLMPAEDTPLRYCTAALPLVKQKANAVLSQLKGAEVVHPRIGILVPESTALVSDSPELSNRASNAAIEWLMGHHYTPFYVPEGHIVNGQEKLAEYKLLIVPYSPYLLPEASEAITGWVKAGGVLVSVGPTGVFTPYGAGTKGIVHEAFGLNEIREKQDGGWLFDGAEEKGREAALGTGRVIYVPLADRAGLATTLSRETAPLRLAEADTTLREYKALPSKTEGPQVQQPRLINDMGLVLLSKGEADNRYLWAVNFNIHETLTPTIRVKGEFRHVVDLMVDGGAPLKADVNDGWTALKTKVGPGQGLLFELR